MSYKSLIIVSSCFGGNHAQRSSFANKNRFHPERAGGATLQRIGNFISRGCEGFRTTKRHAAWHAIHASHNICSNRFLSRRFFRIRSPRFARKGIPGIRRGNEGETCESFLTPTPYSATCSTMTRRWLPAHVRRYPMGLFCFQRFLRRSFMYCPASMRFHGRNWPKKPYLFYPKFRAPNRMFYNGRWSISARRRLIL